MTGLFEEHDCPSCEGDGAYYIVGEAGFIVPSSQMIAVPRDAELIEPCDTCHGKGYIAGPYDEPTREDVEGYR